MLLVSLLPAQWVKVRFEGMDGNDQAVQMDSVVVTNLTKNWTETLYAPYLTLSLTPTGIEHYAQSGRFGLSQNTPNPFDGVTRATLNVEERGDVLVNVTDISGRVVASRHIPSVEEGTHQLRVTLGSNGLYFLTAQQNGQISTVKMVSRGGGGANTVEYMGITGPAREKSQKWVRSNKPWDYGDSLQYVGYITVNDYQHAEWGQPIPTRAFKSLRGTGLLVTQTVTLWFPTRDGTNCLTNGYVNDYDNESYIAMWVGRQCWMGTNLRSRHYPDGTPIARGDEDPSNILASYTTGYYYYPNGTPTVSGSYGLLYNSAAVMRGASYSNEIPSGVQGVCPNGWHVPSLAEWTLMLNYLNSRDEYVCNGIVGFNAKAVATKAEVWSTSSVICSPGNDPSSNGFPDIFAEDNFYSGYDAFPAGTLTNGAHSGFGDLTKFWSSFGILQDPWGYMTQAYGPWIVTNSPTVLVNPSIGADGCSVRCLRDEQETIPPTVTTDSVKYYSSLGQVVCYGRAISHDGTPIVQKGVCWGIYANPTLGGNHVEASSSGAGHFTVSITGLTEGVYHIRAYAKTAAGTVVYGNDMTLYYEMPSVRTDSVSIDPDNPNAFILHGTVTSMGSAQCQFYARGVVYSKLPNPTIWGDDYHVISDDNGDFGSMYHYHPGSFSVSVDNHLASDTKYYVRAFAKNGAGIAYGEVMEFTTGACRGQTTMFDQDGNEYNTVGIGNQCWMKENLRATHFSDGSVIPHALSGAESSTTPYFYSYSSSGISLEQRGFLYNWPAVMHGASSSNANPSGVQGICPNGWHVPSEAEWDQLRDYLSGNNQYVCGNSSIVKALASTSGWLSSSEECAPGNNQSTNNATGFSAIPAGFFHVSFDGVGRTAVFWSSYQYSMEPDERVRTVELQYWDDGYFMNLCYKNRGYSVRCVKN